MIEKYFILTYNIIHIKTTINLLDDLVDQNKCIQDKNWLRGILILFSNWNEFRYYNIIKFIGCTFNTRICNKKLVLFDTIPPVLTKKFPIYFTSLILKRVKKSATLIFSIAEKHFWGMKVYSHKRFFKISLYKQVKRNQTSSQLKYDQWVIFTIFYFTLTRYILQYIKKNKIFSNWFYFKYGKVEKGDFKSMASDVILAQSVN